MLPNNMCQYRRLKRFETFKTFPTFYSVQQRGLAQTKKIGFRADNTADSVMRLWTIIASVHYKFSYDYYYYCYYIIIIYLP